MNPVGGKPENNVPQNDGTEKEPGKTTRPKKERGPHDEQRATREARAERRKGGGADGVREGQMHERRAGERKGEGRDDDKKRPENRIHD